MTILRRQSLGYVTLLVLIVVLAGMEQISQAIDSINEAGSPSSGCVSRRRTRPGPSLPS